MSSSERTTPADKGDINAEIVAAAAVALEIAERSLKEGTTEDISQEAVQALLTAGARLFANKIEMEEKYFLPFKGDESVTATDVVVTVSEMLRAVNLNTFDLAMWFRRPRLDEDL